MSSKGSAFAGDGREYLQEPPAKQARYEHHPAQPHVIEAVTDESNPTVPVPQSDFEIEINSTSQENDSPAAEITLTSQGIPASSITIIGEDEAAHVMTSTGMIAEGHATSIVPVASSISVASVASGGAAIQESALVTQAAAAAAEGGTVASTYTVAGDLSMKNVLISQEQNQVAGQSPDLGTGQFIITPQSSAETPHASGPLYVMIPPSTGTEFLQSMHAQTQSRPIVPRLSNAQIQSPPPTEDVRKQKEVVRKQTHNEVERRRRDRINDLIKVLAQIVPGCQKKDSSSGSIVGYVYSKGTVLEKTVEYIKELITQNEQLTATAKLAEKSASALHVLQNQITVLEKENVFLRTQMIQCGLETTGVLSARNILSSPLAHSLLNTAQAQVATPPALSVPSTTQLLVSLAQSLTSNPLLAATLTQANTAAPSLTGSSVVPPSLTTFAQLSTPTAATQVSPSSSSTSSAGTSNQATLLINSLVQTLASIAAPPSNTASQGQSAAINLAPTASLLNNLLLAQNALNSSSSASAESTVPLILPTTSADQGNSVVAS